MESSSGGWAHVESLLGFQLIRNGANCCVGRVPALGFSRARCGPLPDPTSQTDIALGYKRR